MRNRLSQKRFIFEQDKASREKCIPPSKVFIVATLVKMFPFVYVYVFTLQKEPEQVIATEPPPACQDPQGDRVPSPQTKDHQPSLW